MTHDGYVGVMTGQRPHAFTVCKEMKILIVYFVCCFCVLQTVYSAVTFAGYVGVMTGQRPHAFTVTVDERGK